MRLGPITGATLIVRNLQRSLAAYVDQIGLLLVERSQIPQQRALDMGDASLAQAACARLRGNADAGPWLTLIEMPQAPASSPYARRGWLALVLRVADIDAVAARIDGRSWQVLGEPTERGAGAAMRSLPLAGPDGEVLHLVQITQPAADIDPSAASVAVDRLHAVVLGAANCSTALGFYEGLGLTARWRLRAQLPALDHLPGLCDPAGCPMALGQLAGGHEIEIDQLALLPANDANLRSGIRLISFARSNAQGRRLAAQDDPSARILAGPEGEGIELV